MAINANENTRMKNTRIESVRAQGFTSVVRRDSSSNFESDVRLAVSPQILTDREGLAKEKRPAGEWLCSRPCGTWRDKPRKGASVIGKDKAAPPTMESERETISSTRSSPSVLLAGVSPVKCKPFLTHSGRTAESGLVKPPRLRFHRQTSLCVCRGTRGTLGGSATESRRIK